MRTFKTMLEENRLLAARLHAYFKKHGYSVIDHGDEASYNSIGVTFEIYDPKRDIFRVHVVSDHRVHDTGNLFIEHKMERRTHTAKGWLHYCLADFICYHDVENDVGYLLDWRRMRDDVSGYKLVTFRNQFDHDTVGYGHLIPIDDAYAKGYVVYKYDLKGVAER